MSNADRFLATFNKIERHLRTMTRSDKGTSFFTLVTQAAKKDAVVRRYDTDLKEFADLRNAIVHERTDAHAIAEPYDHTVNALEGIAATLLDPPRLTRFQRSVTTLTTADSVASAAGLMFRKSFSQIPIYSGSQFVALLTTNTIARWLGASIDEDVFSLSETPIGAVLEYAEDQDNVYFMGQRATVFDALERFQDSERRGRRGKRLEAILITGDGRPSNKLLGIITVHDLAAISMIK